MKKRPENMNKKVDRYIEMVYYTLTTVIGGGKMKQEKLIAWRKFHSYTFKDMAELLEVDARTYYNKEQGITQFKANEMYKISDLFDMSIEEIFTRPCGEDRKQEREKVIK